jgi:hypothetical protein
MTQLTDKQYRAYQNLPATETRIRTTDAQAATQ